MTDNTISSFATDDIGGVHYQRTKLSIGADGAATDLSYSKPAPINAGLRTDVIYVGSVSASPVFLLLSASSSSTVTIVAAQASARMRVLSYVMASNISTSVTFNSSVTPLTGVMILNKHGFEASFSPLGHFQTGVGQPLTITTGDGKIGGHLVYVPVSV